MTTPEIEQAATWTAVINGEPVLILLPRMRAVQIAGSGALVSADAWTTAIIEHGAQTMTDLEFDTATAPGWTITLDRDMTAARISGPAALGEIYTGELETNPDWRAQVAQRHHDGQGLVLTGTAERMDPAAALEMMEAERAVWVRADVALR